MEEQRDAESKSDVQMRITLQKLNTAAVEGNWEAAKVIIDSKPEALTAKLNGEGMTALHVGANCGRSEFVRNLVKILSPEELEMKDQSGRNVLHYVAVASSVRTAKAILEKNRKLAQDKEVFGFTPLFYAARWRNPSQSKEILEYLYKETDAEVYKDAETAPSLTVAITASGCHGIALKVLQRFPSLALKTNLDGWSILHSLATQPSAFLSGNKSFMLKTFKKPWVKIATAKQRRHDEAMHLVHFVCNQLSEKRESAVMDYFFPHFNPPILFLATERGVFEIVEVCLKYFPNLIWYSAGGGKLLLHVAVEHRQTKIFKHVMQLIGENAGAYAHIKVADNNILHLAAKLAPTRQLHSIPGPAFQMQRELQWFKAVESIVYTVERHEKNAEQLTPEELFFKTHDKLIKDAKEWMKDTSTSCMVVAALVATVAFASMITVPGGNNDTGMPILTRQKVFVVFSAANALSMIASAIALLMFLSLQTSRYSNKDFLESLPKNLVGGLLALLVAVATMMIAFGAAIGLSLETRIKWFYIPITIIASIPAIIFVLFHFPLLVQTLSVKSGPVIYGQHTLEMRKGCLDKIDEFLKPLKLV